MKVFIGYKDLFAKNYRVQGLLVEKKRERGGRWKERKNRLLLAKLPCTENGRGSVWKSNRGGGYEQNNHLLPLDIDRTEEGAGQGRLCLCGRRPSRVRRRPRVGGTERGD
jgi:hypothetical protein